MLVDAGVESSQKQHPTREAWALFIMKSGSIDRVDGEGIVIYRKRRKFVQMGAASVAVGRILA